MVILKNEGESLTAVNLEGLRVVTNYGKSMAPVRIDFGGPWTDIHIYSDVYGGATLNTTINKYARVTVKPFGVGVILESRDYGGRAEVKDGESLLYDGNLNMLKAAVIRSSAWHLHVITKSDAPLGAGLGGSAAMAVALVGLLNHGLEPTEIAEFAYRLEMDELKNLSGKQDQYAAVFGGINLFEFSKDGVKINPVVLDKETKGELERRLVLFYTGESRISGDVHKHVWGNYGKLVKNFHNMKRIAYDQRDALTEGRLDDFGRLLTENWENQKALSGCISNETIDNLFNFALKNGAVGGKLCGAGGGGCGIFLAQRGMELHLRKRLKNYLSENIEGGKIVDFKFNDTGLRVAR